MINHGRNLLMNVDGQGYIPGMPAEEYIPPTYKATTLPAWLQRVRQIVFGPNPDKLMLNFRTRQLLQLLHSTELSRYLTDFDSRITYKFENDVYDLGVGITVDQLAGDDIEFRVLGSENQATGRPSLYREWTLEVLDDEQVEIRQLRPSGETTTVEYTTAGNQSSAISLPGSSLTVQFQANPYSRQEATLTAPGWTDPEDFNVGAFNVSVSGDFVGTVVLQRSFDNGSTWEDVEDYTEPTEEYVEVTDATVLWRVGVESISSGTATVVIEQITSPSAVGSRWNIRLFNRPALGLESIMQASQGMGEDTILRLFGSTSPTAGIEPYGTFYRLWRKHHELPYALGGLILALIYRTEEARNV